MQCKLSVYLCKNSAVHCSGCTAEWSDTQLQCTTFFFFFWHPFKFIARNRLSPDVELPGECRTHNMHFMVFPSAVHLRFQFLNGITSHIMLLSWGPRCLGTASFAPGRPRQHRHLRGLAPSPSKDHCPGAGYIIFTPRKERLRMGYTVGLYFPRLAGVSWNPLAHVVQDLAGFVASHLGIKQAQYG